APEASPGEHALGPAALSWKLAMSSSGTQAVYQSQPALTGRAAYSSQLGVTRTTYSGRSANWSSVGAASDDHMSRTWTRVCPSGQSNTSSGGAPASGVCPGAPASLQSTTRLQPS